MGLVGYSGRGGLGWGIGWGERKKRILRGIGWGAGLEKGGRIWGGPMMRAVRALRGVGEDRLGLGCGAGWKAVPGDWALKRVGRGLGLAVGGRKWALVDTLGVD